jgi:hypothetical protein
LDNSRCGDECWYWTAVERVPMIWRRGILWAWSTDHQEYDSGPGPIPVAVIEDLETHAVHSVYVGHVSFAAEKPSAK